MGLDEEDEQLGGHRRSEEESEENLSGRNGKDPGGSHLGYVENDSENDIALKEKGQPGVLESSANDKGNMNMAAMSAMTAQTTERP